LETAGSPSWAKVIVNPVAGAGKTARKWPGIRALLTSLGLRFEHEITEASGHAVELARNAVRKGYELMVAVGGDGTINEIVNGIYHADGMSQVSLGIIGTGTGSDYIRSVGLSRHHETACRNLLRPRKLVVDLGVVEYSEGGEKIKRLFVNFAGLGFDAEVVRATTQKYKALGSLPSYLMGLLTTFVSYDNKRVVLRLDGEAVERKVCTVLMSNGKYGGGGMLTAPDADLADGWLDVLIIDDLSKLDLLRSLPRIYRGTHLSHPKVTLKRAQKVEIESQEVMALQADGELLGAAPAIFYLMPSSLNLLV
jgi:YegS/Rv2252/BmrU family lipid kinase